MKVGGATRATTCLIWHGKRSERTTAHCTRAIRVFAREQRRLAESDPTIKMAMALNGEMWNKFVARVDAEREHDFILELEAIYRDQERAIRRMK